MKRIEYEGEIHEFPDDFTDGDIAKALGSKVPGLLPGSPDVKAYQPVTTSFGRPLMRAGGDNVTVDPRKALALRALDMAPGLGMSASIPFAEAPPLAIGAAYLGGNAGEQVREAGYRALGEYAPAPFTRQAFGAQHHAGMDGAMSEMFLGQVPGAAISEYRAARAPRMAERAMNQAQDLQGAALRPSKAVLEKDPQVVRHSLEEQNPISGGYRMRAHNQSTTSLKASHAAEDAMASESRSFTRWSPSQLVEDMRARLKEKAPKNEVKNSSDSKEWEAQAQRFIDRFSTPANPHHGIPAGEKPFDIQDMLIEKRAADKKAMELHSARESAAPRGGSVPLASAEEEFEKLKADVLRDAIKKEVPGLGRQMQRTREMMAQQLAHFDAEARPDVSPEAIEPSKHGVARHLLRRAMRIGDPRAETSSRAMRSYADALEYQRPKNYSPYITRRALPLAARSFDRQPDYSGR